MNCKNSYLKVEAKWLTKTGDNMNFVNFPKVTDNSNYYVMDNVLYLMDYYQNSK